MADRPFVHLHCHTHYSLLDGASRVPELVQLTKSLGMNSIAMTDHGNLFGAIEFYKECSANGINPVVGYEAYVAPTHRTDRSMKKRGESGYHLTLLAQNVQGFHNLIKLASIAYLEGYHYIPRIDKEVLEAHSKGLICLSGCASSEFSDYILLDQMDKARDAAIWFSKIFGDNFYVEIQNNGLDIQKRCAEGAIDIANELGLPLVATSDAHYLKQDDNFAHDVLLCINTGRLIKDENRMRYGSDQFYVRPPEEMYKLFPGHEEAVKRSQEIANKCDIKLDFKKRHFPVFTPPEKKTPEAYLRELCEIGLMERYGPEATPEAHARLDAAKARLEHELGIILRMGFAGYFLIVWDFVRFAISKNIPASARGSACGAVVSYVLKLSHVCPLEYDLLFERFLDPNRSEAPDIDIDFCQDQREEVIKYVRERYGEASVAQIATFGTMAAKAAIKDVGRVMDVPLERVTRLTGMVPKVLNISLQESLDQSPDLRREYDNDTEVRKLIDIAMKLEGTNRNVGTHAAGVVIANGPITDYVPVQRMQRKDGKEGHLITTQWVMGDLEKVGMLKMDFLGLRTLTVVENALKLIRKSRLGNQKLQALEDRDPRTYDLLKHGIDRIPLTDKKTYELLQRGDARGVFQLESDGIRELLKRMRPDNIRDLIATNALYRPGPLGGGMVDAYVNRKNGREKPVYAHPIMEEILSETYGVMCIHEDTRISMADGSEKLIKSVRRGDRVHSLNYQTKRFEIKDCHGCGPTRRGDGLHIVLENGFSVVLTPDHEVLTYDGLKKAEELDQKRDLVAVGLHLKQHSIPECNIAPWLGNDIDVAYLIGLLIGDGCMTGDSATLATGTKKNHDILVQWLRERLPKLRLHEYFHTRSWYVSISCPELLNQPGTGNRKTKLHFLLDTLELKKSAHFKRVPAIIFQCTAEARAALVAGLFDTDGCLAQTNRGSGLCFLTSVSQDLLNDVRRLCQLEGIPVMVRKNRIHLWNLERAARILEPFLLLKKFKGKLNFGASVGWIPRSVIKLTIPAGESVRSFCVRTTIERSSLRHSFPFVKSSTAAKAGIDLGDIRYMQIVRIERVADQQFYGMSVADHHNLVANGIVVKNCYQEQIMRILNKLGDIELSSAYACIKAISKKKEDIINARRMEFLNGASAKGVPEATAKEIFDLICFFGGYGFNKSHSAAYAKLGYQTAYLKTHYPAEFMAALLTSEIDDSNKRDIMVEHIDDARRLGSEVLPPNIQDGEAEFTVKNNKIVFGLLAIKGLGRGAAEDIVRARNDGGPFKDFFDFCERIDQKLVPKAGIERLIKVGAFDCTGAKRSQLWDALPGALQAASQAQDDRKHGQLNLFEVMDAGNGDAVPSANDKLKNIPEWVPLEKLKYEKESLDFYISSHPLGQYEETLRRFSGAAANSLKSLDANSEVFIGGMLTVVRFMNTKKARNGSSRYARFKLEDFSGVAECVMWPDDYVKYKDLVEEDKIVFVQAVVERKTEEPILQVTSVMTMEEGQLKRTTGLVMLMDLTDSEDEDLRKMESIRNVLHRSRGNLPVFLHVRDGAGKWLRMKVSDDLRINPATISKADLETILGVGRVEFSRQGNGTGRG